MNTNQEIALECLKVVQHQRLTKDDTLAFAKHLYDWVESLDTVKTPKDKPKK